LAPRAYPAFLVLYCLMVLGFCFLKNEKFRADDNNRFYSFKTLKVQYTSIFRQYLTNKSLNYIFN
jgi:hypothetical protein